MWEIIAFVCFDILAFIAVAAITYRWLFKRLFDILFSGICIVLLSPLFLAFAIRNKIVRREGKTPVVKERYVGKKGKLVEIRRALKKSGKLFSIYSLLDVFEGKLSFIGVAPFRPSDAEFLEGEELDRQTVRPGLINPLILGGDEETTYDDMVENDVRYARSFSLFKDCAIFFKWLLNKIRGEGYGYLGETKEKTYARSLLDDERITQSDYDAAMKLDEGENGKESEE